MDPIQNVRRRPHGHAGKLQQAYAKPPWDRQQPRQCRSRNRALSNMFMSSQKDMAEQSHCSVVAVVAMAVIPHGA